MPTYLIRKVMLLMVAIAMLFAGEGCSMRSGRQLDSHKVATIERGKTTRAEVEAMFGAPIHTAVLERGRRMMVYAYSKTTGFQFLHVGASETESQMLQILIDANGVVEDYELSNGEDSFFTH